MKALKRTSRAFDNVLLFSMPRAEANMCSTEAESTHSWHLKNVLRMWTNQGCPCYRDGSKNGIVVGWITNVMVLNEATI
jgi:hypothetical protein